MEVYERLPNLKYSCKCSSKLTLKQAENFSTVEHSEYFTPSEVPEKLLRMATGNVIFQEILPYVSVDCFLIKIGL